MFGCVLTESVAPILKLQEPDNGNVHRAAAKIVVSKSRAARGSVCNVLLSRHAWCHPYGPSGNRLVSGRQVIHQYLSVVATVVVDQESTLEVK